MFCSYLRLLLFILGLLFGVQVFGFIDDYVKCVDVYCLEVVQNIQGFQQIVGQFFNGSLEELVRYYCSNSDLVFQCDGENFDCLMCCVCMFDVEWQVMQGFWYVCVWYMLCVLNYELLMEIYVSYSYQVLFKFEVIVWGLGCVLLVVWIVELIVYLLVLLFGFGEDCCICECYWS